MANVLNHADEEIAALNKRGMGVAYTVKSALATLTAERDAALAQVAALREALDYCSRPPFVTERGEKMCSWCRSAAHGQCYHDEQCASEVAATPLTHTAAAADAFVARIEAETKERCAEFFERNYFHAPRADLAAGIRALPTRAGTGMSVGECLTSGGHIFSNYSEETKTRCARCGHRPRGD